MKKILFVLIALFSGISALSAQDIITKKNGHTIECNVIEVDDRNIMYRHLDDPYGKTYTIRKSEVLMIGDKAGNVDLISEMKYKDLRRIYDFKDWKPSSVDLYNPSRMGLYSWLVPGLGQMLCGEKARGAGLLAGAVGSLALTGAGAGMYVAYNRSYRNDDPIHGGYYVAGVFTMALGVLSLITVDVCAIVDACRVAKVKNIYEQSWRKQVTSVELHPYVDYLKTGQNLQPAAGLTLALKF